MKRNPINALEQAKAWDLDVRQARYSEWGNFYGLLDRFPAALLDAGGYYLVRTADDLNVAGISVGKRINVPMRIGSLAAYVEVALPDEISSHESVWEGAKQSITVNVYERKRSARRACVEHWGTRCAACELDFAKLYGPDFEGTIHVHHVVPLASIGGTYQLDPIEDLRPVCPNCHAAIHSRPRLPPYTIAEIRNRLAQAKHGG